MFLMSNSLVLCGTYMFFSQSRFPSTFPSRDSYSAISIAKKRRRFPGLVGNVKNDKSRKRTWWEKFFFDDDENWLGLKEDVWEEGLSGEEGGEVPEGERFEAWKRRVEAISELQEAQDEMRTSESRDWEDWLGEVSSGVDNSSSDRDWDIGLENGGGGVPDNPSELDTGFVGAAKDLVFRNDDDELLYEDKVFRYASNSTAKFLALLVLIPWALDFLVHDYVLMPFLDRYVKTTPLAAELLDVRRSQKLEMIKTLKLEKARYRLEVEIGKSPPLSDEEIWLELRPKAIELRDEWRLENRKTFANIWSDMVFGIALFILIYCNQSKVALMKFTGYKILKNVSDTGKAFLIILVTDIFLGYHSESGWQTLIEIILEHYGLEVDKAAVTIFISFVPVIIDACVKLWLFKFLPRLSPNVANIFREMKRH